jgi:hypothetical protein
LQTLPQPMPQKRMHAQSALTHRLHKPKQPTHKRRRKLTPLPLPLPN